MNNRYAIASVGIALFGMAACSDSPVAPSATPTLTKPSFVIATSPRTPIAGQVWVCKVWLGAPGGAPSVTTTANPARSTLTLSNTNIANLAPGTDGCLQVAASTASTVDANPGWSEDHIIVTETLDPGTSFVSGKVFFSGGQATEEFTSTTRNQTFNTFHGAVIVFENEVDEVAEVCDRYTWGGHRKDLGYTYGGHAGLNTEGLAWGSFEFNNHITGDKYHVWNITSYGKPLTGVLSGTELGRYASGTGLKNGTTEVFMEFRFIDNGEPGTSDQVWLAIDGQVVLPLQNVTGGNVQLHDQCKKAPKAEKH